MGALTAKILQLPQLLDRWGWRHLERAELFGGREDLTAAFEGGWLAEIEHGLGHFGALAWSESEVALVAFIAFVARAIIRILLAV